MVDQDLGTCAHSWILSKALSKTDTSMLAVVAADANDELVLGLAFSQLVKHPLQDLSRVDFELRVFPCDFHDLRMDTWMFAELLRLL